jgi:protein arginine N-methyltransferase 1
MSCLKNYVMREPLVDTVDKRQICTDHFPLKTFDLKTITINDINIDTKFRLRALRDDYIHAFVTYFLVEFTACPQKTVINTGMYYDLGKTFVYFEYVVAPGAGYTHWKQTVFYFPDCATIKFDETIEGNFSCNVNLEHPVCRKSFFI